MAKRPLPDHVLEVFKSRWDGTAVVLRQFQTELGQWGWSRTDILDLVKDLGLKNDDTYLAMTAALRQRTEPDDVQIPQFTSDIEETRRASHAKALARTERKEIAAVAPTPPAPAPAPAAERVPMRRCTKCGKEYPATLEYFAKHHRATGHIGKLCIACHSASFRQGALTRMAKLGIPRSERTLRREQADRDRAVTIIQEPVVQQLRGTDPARFAVLESTMKTLPIERGAWSKADKLAFMKVLDSVLDFVFDLDDETSAKAS